MARASVSLSNLRAGVIVIVVAFHASLAYLVSAPAPTSAFSAEPHAWQAFPVVDSQRWMALDIFCAWQDVSLMALMFLLSGILAAGSLQRKAPATYIADRLRRIGLPFLLAIAILSPLSFYPAYLMRTTEASVADFAAQWFSLPLWPIGPQWFLWQLLVLNVLAALVCAAAPGCLDRLRRAGAWFGTRPLQFCALLIGASLLAYVPLALAVSPWTWDGLGPFSLQLCRPLLYLVFFTVGLALGSHGLDRGLLACDGPLARTWWLWLIAAPVGFAVWAGLTSMTFPDWEDATLALQTMASLAYPFACAAGVVLWLACCLRFAATLRVRLLDSLSSNAYSIYLLHYVPVVWLQYALLGSGFPAIAKVMIVLTGALALSWAIAAAWGRLVAGAAPGQTAVRAAPARIS